MLSKTCTIGPFWLRHSKNKEVLMLKSVLLLTLLSSVSLAQLADKTEVCYPAAIKVATYKIAKDSKAQAVAFKLLIYYSLI